MPDSLSIDILQTLKNLLDMYEYEPWEVLVLEAVANGMDAGANRIDIRFGDQNTVMFHNNGRPMGKRDFANYHKISSSTKRKGEGIGFAGVGAKIYLAAWPKAEMVTESGQGSDRMASRMFRKGRKVLYEYPIKAARPKAGDGRGGTSYAVRLEPKQYDTLQKNIHKVLQFWFSYAMTFKTLALYVDGESVKPYAPTGTIYRMAFKYKNTEFKMRITISDKAVDTQMRYLTYHVYGKRIKQELVDYEPQIHESFRDRIMCMVDATPLAKHLVANKENFHTNFHVNSVKGEIRKQLQNKLVELKLVVKPGNGEARTNKATESLEKSLARALKAMDLSNLWLDASRGAGTRAAGPDDAVAGMVETADPPENSQDADVSDTPEKSKSDREPKTPRPRRNLGISIIMENHENDPREGWVDVGNSAIVYNTGHKFSKSMEKPAELHRYNLSRVAISALIGHHREQPGMDVEKALNYLAQLLQKVY